MRFECKMVIEWVPSVGRFLFYDGEAGQKYFSSCVFEVRPCLLSIHALSSQPHSTYRLYVALCLSLRPGVQPALDNEDDRVAAKRHFKVTPCPSLSAGQ